MQIKAVLFDFDGVLLDSFECSFRGCTEVFRQFKLPLPSREEFATELRHPYIDFYRNRGIEATLEEIFLLHNSVSQHENAKLFPDAPHVIETLAKQDFHLGIVSAQRTHIVERHLAQALILDHFDYIVAQIEDKTPHIEQFCQNKQLDPSSVIYIGDFPSDMVYAKRAGVRAVGCLRLPSIRKELVRSGADHLIRELDEIFSLLE